MRESERLLISFYTEIIKDGISRVVNNLPDPFAPLREISFSNLTQRRKGGET